MTSMATVSHGHRSTSISTVCEQLPSLAQETFGVHPFEQPLGKDLLESLLPDFLAMSQAFPYLQAAAHKERIFEVIAQNCDVSMELELTAAVANFLCWDETGGHDVVLQHGNAGLPYILETERRFHSNLFRRDASKALGRPVHAHYGPATQRYLRALYNGLSAADPVSRCAHMIAFELHAAVMIKSLWGSLAAATGIAKEELPYFQVHVGGNDPAEHYHGEMARRLIEKIVPARQLDRFVEEFKGAYQLSFEWCRNLARSRRLPAAHSLASEVWHDGACHCRGVRFQVRAPAVLSAVRCNCSICDMTGFLHLMVAHDHVRILSGDDLLTIYQFNLRIATHTFCRVCGVKAFYRPRSNPEGYSVNVRCLDRSTVEGLKITDFDGQHWEEAIQTLHKQTADFGAHAQTL